MFATITILFIGGTAPEQAQIPPLVAAVGMLGITAGLCLRYVYHHFRYWVDSRDLRLMSHNELQNIPLREALSQNLRNPLFWLTWVAGLALAAWYAFTTLW